jgi:Predicted periplasmic protein (DUF2092)
MTDYLSNQKTLSASFDSDIEVITPELQKIRFASSGQIKLSRPDKLRVRRTGGYADVELVYDGMAEFEELPPAPPQEQRNDRPWRLKRAGMQPFGFPG